ncbi:AcrR family transcriptional regulator [Arthrobacter sp. V4I6]|uniref:TetR/AcrR family transcriptional regulator n=1 Tax=unclassified Arthrobacter TaxID=235627 RepID=UPI00277D8D59|nr:MULTISPECIES: TetR/AcrR family transcriptional regulator C-terminal domain-containing protein [unclassified Arthrobacter]MDQ0819552.1 AcrR family transcriptional regulator [Arthrobacter sp. V1I7]MDQ0853733.1 AcrR family transcriptional regulator [Arthrobacter sp. V4I6]
MPRPHSPLLSVEAIVNAALALVDETGDFSFPKVARKIGVSQSALYNYIDNREHIVELMRGRLFADQVVPPVEDLPWDEALRVLVRIYRDGFAAHPRLVPLLVTQTVQDVGVVSLYENIAFTLERAGLDLAHIGPAIATIDYLALGAALELTAPEVVWSPPAGEFPALHRAVAHSGSVNERAESAFGFGLDVLVAGVRAKALHEIY